MIGYTDYAAAATGFELEVEYPPIVDNDGEKELAVPVAEPDDDRPAEQRIYDLFDHMPGCRAALLAVIDACRSRRPEDEVTAAADIAQRNRGSVYSGLALCRMLEKAGALEHVRGNGDPYDEDSLLPETIVEDGVEYLRPIEPPASYWQSTAAGIAYADADDPAARARAVVEGDGTYASVYKFILEACAGAGAAGKELAAVIEAHPLTQEPRLLATHFIKKLEDAGAIVWDGKWRLSEKAAGSLSWLDGIATLERQEDER